MINSVVILWYSITIIYKKYCFLGSTKYFKAKYYNLTIYVKVTM